MKKMNKKGFTIVELVIVIAVIGILATVLIPTFSGVIGDANNESIRLGARNAFVEYTAANPDEIGGDFLYIDGDKAVAIKDGKLVTDEDGEVKIYDYKTEANKTAVLDDIKYEEEEGEKTYEYTFTVGDAIAGSKLTKLTVNKAEKAD